jgi:hypothetical protein
MPSSSEKIDLTTLLHGQNLRKAAAPQPQTFLALIDSEMEAQQLAVVQPAGCCVSIEDGSTRYREGVLARPPERFTLRAQVLTAQRAWSGSRSCVRGGQHHRAACSRPGSFAAGARHAAALTWRRPPPSSSRERRRDRERSNSRRSMHRTSQACALAIHRLLMAAISSVLWQTRDGRGGVGIDSGASSNVCAWCVCVHCPISMQLEAAVP